MHSFNLRVTFQYVPVSTYDMFHWLRHWAIGGYERKSLHFEWTWCTLLRGLSDNSPPCPLSFAIVLKWGDMGMNYWTTISIRYTRFSLVTQKINQDYKGVLSSVVDYIHILTLVHDNCCIVENNYIRFPLYRLQSVERFLNNSGWILPTALIMKTASVLSIQRCCIDLNAFGKFNILAQPAFFLCFCFLYSKPSHIDPYVLPIGHSASLHCTPLSHRIIEMQNTHRRTRTHHVISLITHLAGSSPSPVLKHQHNSGSDLQLC